MINAEDVKDIGATLKIVVFLEQEPLSDTFAQVLITQEQYPKLTQWFVDNKVFPCESDHNGETCPGIFTSDRYKNIKLTDIPHMYTMDDLHNPLK